MPNKSLALFDFDGTITVKGTYPGFVRFAIGRQRKIVGGILLSPLLVGYQTQLVSDRTIRRAMSRVAFQGDDPQRVRGLGKRYASDVLPGLIRPAALERIAWHKTRGDVVVIVSASLDVYLEPWCGSLSVDVICTQLETADGRLTGRYLRGDCCGMAKAERIRERYALTEFSAIYAYGDSEDDRQMLEMATRRYFRWQEVSRVPASSRVTRRGDGGT
jgi:HAD superfamily hydrolase (TIGR01490 family)